MLILGKIKTKQLAILLKKIKNILNPMTDDLVYQSI